MLNRTSLTLLVACSFPVGAQADVFATFPNVGSVIFTRTATTFTGSGTIPLFTMGTQVYPNAKFSMTPLTTSGTASIISSAVLSAGSFTILDSTGTNTLMTAIFSSARLESNGSWNTAFNASSAAGDSITFGGQSVAFLNNQLGNGISFALSPKIGVPNSYDASFSAVGSVQAVPEPASIAGLGVAVVAFVRRRRGSV